MEQLRLGEEALDVGLLEHAEELLGAACVPEEEIEARLHDLTIVPHRRERSASGEVLAEVRHVPAILPADDDVGRVAGQAQVAEEPVAVDLAALEVPLDPAIEQVGLEGVEGRRERRGESPGALQVALLLGGVADRGVRARHEAPHHRVDVRRVREHLGPGAAQRLELSQGQLTVDLATAEAELRECAEVREDGLHQPGDVGARQALEELDPLPVGELAPDQLLEQRVRHAPQTLARPIPEDLAQESFGVDDLLVEARRPVGHLSLDPAAVIELEAQLLLEEAIGGGRIVRRVQERLSRLDPSPRGRLAAAHLPALQHRRNLAEPALTLQPEARVEVVLVSPGHELIEDSAPVLGQGEGLGEAQGELVGLGHVAGEDRRGGGDQAGRAQGGAHEDALQRALLVAEEVFHGGGADVGGRSTGTRTRWNGALGRRFSRTDSWRESEIPAVRVRGVHRPLAGSA